jgi:predicted transcriptional regulator of viral defense system
VSGKSTTKECILTYLQVDTEPVALYLIHRYMAQMHRVSYGAVREQLARLRKAGAIERVGWGKYRISAGLAQLEQSQPD